MAKKRTPHQSPLSLYSFSLFRPTNFSVHNAQYAVLSALHFAYGLVKMNLLDLAQPEVLHAVTNHL